MTFPRNYILLFTLYKSKLNYLVSRFDLSFLRKGVLNFRILVGILQSHDAENMWRQGG